MTLSALARRRAGVVRAAAMALACGACVAVPASPAAAQFADNAAGRAQSLTSASLSAPAGLTVVSAPYKCRAGKTIVISLSWTATAGTDADGNPLVTYYAGYRSIDGSAFAEAFSTSGSAPATAYSDTFTCPAGRKGTSFSVEYYLVAGTGDGAGFISPASPEVGASISHN